MEALTKKNIYLLEVLIDQVKLEEDNKFDLQMMYGNTCVSFSFLDNGPFSICEEDFHKGCGNLKSGKSCLFSLTPKQMNAARKTFNLSMEVHKTFTAGAETSSTQIGCSKLPLEDLFTELLKTVVKKGTPCSKTMKRCVPVLADEKERRGSLSLYVRMSCFGKVVITRFQMNMDEESIEFKATNGHSNYRYSKSSGVEMLDDYCAVASSGFSNEFVGGGRSIQGKFKHPTYVKVASAQGSKLFIHNTQTHP